MKIQKYALHTVALSNDVLANGGLFLNGHVVANVAGQNQKSRVMSHRRLVPEVITNAHQWVSVLDPRNYQTLLQACDDCGIVKSESSMARNCRGERGQGVISKSQKESKLPLM